jgi:glycosyltransferase involved in cell wall biosynthesis
MSAPVSVVIPCFNYGRYLATAIESALAQDTECEIIVVDDGSTDETAAVAARYAGVRYLRQPNRGLPAARNAGLGASTGEYVIFLDADDRLLPIAASTGVDALARQPYAAFAVGRERKVAVDLSPLPESFRPRVDRDHYVSLIRRCWILTPGAVTFRRRALMQIGAFDVGMRFAEDYELYLRIARHFPIVDHYVVVMEYRQHAVNHSRNAAPMLLATLEALARHRPGRGASAAHREAYRARLNAVWYYDRLLESVLAEARAWRWGTAMSQLAVFARSLPRHPSYAAWRLTTPVRMAARTVRRHAGA